MMFNRRLMAGLAALFWLICASAPVHGAATLDRAVCTAADKAGGNASVCSGQELIDAANQEINHVYDIGVQVLNSVAGTDDYTASVTPSLTALTTGQTFWFKPSNTNTTTVRVNINGLGLTATVRADGSAFGAGQLLPTNWYPLFYNGTNLRCTTCHGEFLLSAGGTADAPLKIQAGTNLTTAEDGAIEFDGTNFFLTADDGNRGVVMVEHFMMLNANYTLTSTVAEQKLFNSTTNGQLTLEAGTYEFEAMLSLTTMSATSGNGAFDILGAGGATLGTVLYEVRGVDGAVSTAAAGSTTTVIAGQSPASMVTAATGTELQAQIRGVFRISAGGTIVPSITLVTAAAAVVRNGSYFKTKRIGSAAVTNVGQWD